MDSISKAIIKRRLKLTSNYKHTIRNLLTRNDSKVFVLSNYVKSKTIKDNRTLIFVQDTDNNSRRQKTYTYMHTNCECN